MTNRVAGERPLRRTACAVLWGCALVVAAGCQPSSQPPTHTTRVVELPIPEIPTDGPVHVEARGREFFWDFRFAGKDNRFQTADDIPVGRELHLPLGRDVSMQITSDDYVYSFSVPALNLRRLAVPELMHDLDFHTTSAGRFDAVVDPMCGVLMFHSGPMGRVLVEPSPSFDAWLCQIPNKLASGK